MRRNSISSTWTTCYSQGELEPIEVQVLVRNGLPRLDIIGLPQNMIREGKDRILSSLSHLGIELPTQRILISLNPGNISKEGSHFDLPILVGILSSLGMIPQKDGKSFYWGELGLDGVIRPLENIIAHLLFASRFTPNILLSSFPNEMSMDFVLDVLDAPISNIGHAASLLSDNYQIRSRASDLKSASAIQSIWKNMEPKNSRWNTLKGSREQFDFWGIATLGRLHLLLEGPPGTGKSTWCFSADELQLPLERTAFLEKFRYRGASSANVNSVLELVRPPFEAPHHGASAAAIIGGGSGAVTIGAATRAHRGILFMDEFTEYQQHVLESLREPLENQTISIARSGATQVLPTNIQLLAAMNACKCGNLGSKKICTCTPHQFHSHRNRISGPLRDRFHIRSWWSHEPQDRRREFDLIPMKHRLVSAFTSGNPSLDGIRLPHEVTPRRQRKWLEVLISWCRWHGIHSPTEIDLKRFSQFLKQMEVNGDEQDNRRSIART